MKTKIRYTAFFIAISMLFSSFAILSANALDEQHSINAKTNVDEILNLNEKVDTNDVNLAITEQSVCTEVSADENVIIVTVGEDMELQPVIAMSCQGPGTVFSSGNYAGYRYSYNSNAAQPYNLGHPDGRSLGIGDYALFDLCNDYQSTIEAMLNAEANNEALTEMLGIAVTVAMVLAGQNINISAIKTLSENKFIAFVIGFLSQYTDIDSDICDQIVEILKPSFVDIQYLMNEADNIFDDLYDMCSN